MDQKLEPQFARLVKTGGFIKCFWEQCSYFKLQEDAYEATETIYKSVFGVRKYKTFDSFRAVMYKYLKNKNEKI